MYTRETQEQLTTRARVGVSRSPRRACRSDTCGGAAATGRCTRGGRSADTAARALPRPGRTRCSTPRSCNKRHTDTASECEYELRRWRVRLGAPDAQRVVDLRLARRFFRFVGSLLARSVLERREREDLRVRETVPAVVLREAAWQGRESERQSERSQCHCPDNRTYRCTEFDVDMTYVNLLRAELIDPTQEREEPELALRLVVARRRCWRSTALR